MSLIGFTATTNPTKSTILLKEGQTYTESVKIEGSLPDNAYIGVSISNSSGAFLSEFALNSTTAKSHTFTATAAQYALRYWTVSIPSGESVDCTIYLKFEIGDKATDWTPAPEDVQPIELGGTGATTATARANLGLTGIETKTLLWQNARPTSEFGNQTLGSSDGIPDLSNYDSLEIEFKTYSASNDFHVSRHPIGVESVLTTTTGGNPTLCPVMRIFTSNASGITFSDYLDWNFGKNNTVCVPTKIYGIKGV